MGKYKQKAIGFYTKGKGSTRTVHPITRGTGHKRRFREQLSPKRSSYESILKQRTKGGRTLVSAGKTPKDLNTSSAHNIRREKTKMEIIDKEIRAAEREIKTVRPTSPLVRDNKDYIDALNALKNEWGNLSDKQKRRAEHILTTPTFDLDTRIRIINRQILDR